jgi:succinate dehydrogenase (ubiquinone) membrane anchor subunit
MASLTRTTMLRQSQLLLASKQLCATRSLATKSLRPTPSSLGQRSQPSILATVPRFAPFSTSSQKNIMPPGPQVIEGGINEPAPVPKPSPIHGSYHWTFERLLSIGLIPLTIAPFAAGSLNPAMDAVLVFTLIVHSHMGFQSVPRFLLQPSELTE